MNADQAARAIEDMVERFGPARTAARLEIPQATLAAIIEGAEDVSEELAETVEEWVADQAMYDAAWGRSR